MAITFLRWKKSGLLTESVTAGIILLLSYFGIYSSRSGKLTTNITFLADIFGNTSCHNERLKAEIKNNIDTLISSGIIHYVREPTEKETTNRNKYNSMMSYVLGDTRAFFDFNQINDSVAVNNESFVLLTESELEKILDSDCSKKDTLLVVFLHIKKYINMGKTENYYCSASLERLVNDCRYNVSNMSVTTITRYIDVLVNIGLLKEHITGSYEMKPMIEVMPNIIRNAVNFYCLADRKMNHEYCDTLAKSYIEEKYHFKVDRFIRTAVYDNYN